MKKFVLLLLLLASGTVFSKANNLEIVTNKLYNQRNINLPKREVFEKALAGFNNLVSNKVIEEGKNIITVIDFSLSSTKKRLWVIDLERSKVIFNDYVSHGKNTGEDLAEHFSNIPNSNQSSLGFYKTGVTYFGKHGLSLRLHGLEKGYNDNAFKRAIVMHSADYVSENFIKKYGRLGRSFGCPSVSKKIGKDLIELIAEGSCLFIYYPDQNYLSNSSVLNGSGLSS